MLAKPSARCSGAVDCLTTANVAPSPNDFHVWASESPTKIQTYAGTTSPASETGPSTGASHQTANPKVVTTANAVSASREPIRSESAPPG